MGGEISIEQDSSGITVTLLFGIAFFFAVFIPWIVWRPQFPLIYFPLDLDNTKQYTFFRWIKETWMFSSSNLLYRSGMKSVLVLKWKLHLILFCAFLTFIDCSVLLPIFITQSDVSLPWFSRTTSSSLPLNSTYAWATFTFTIVISILFLVLVIVHRKGHLISIVK